MLTVSTDPSDVESVTLRYLMYVLVPAWFIPGVADWVMHRKTRIEATSGVRESLIHTLMMGEISVPVTLVLLCEVNPVLLALCLTAGAVPFMAISALLCLHWDQAADRSAWAAPLSCAPPPARRLPGGDGRRRGGADRGPVRGGTPALRPPPGELLR